MKTILLNYNPISFDPEFLFFVAVAILTILIGLFSLLEILFGDFVKSNDRIFWGVLLLMTAGLAGYFYLFARKGILKKYVNQEGK